VKENTLNLGWMSVVEHRKLGTESVGSSIFRIESWELSLLPEVSAWNMRNCELMFSYFLHAKKNVILISRKSI